MIIEKDVYDDIHKDEVVLKYCKKLLGAKEFLNNKSRYCLWLNGVSASELRKSDFIMKRLKQCAEFRLKSPKAATRKCAETPWLFMENRQPNSEYILVPRHSSENRKYVPMGFFPRDVISTDANSIIANADLYEFGVLESNVHMAWMRTVCGRIKSDYRYSNDIVYNNFPWPTPTPAQKERIEKTAQAILDARALYPESSLADLYDELTMPVELRKAHRANDKAVMEAYGFWGRLNSEAACVAELMKLYKALTEQ